MKIECKNVTVEIDKKIIINDISVNIEDGKFVGVIGPNGSGKSTLLKTMYRVMNSTNGCVLIDGEDMANIKSKDIAKVLAVLSQESAANFDFTVEDVVMMGRSPHKKTFQGDTKSDYQMATKALEKVGMDSFKERNFLSLSGGEKQRVLLARALCQEPKILILDEPTNHLDIKYQLQLMDIVKELKVTTFAAIHDMNIAAKYCDRIYGMKNGNLICEGTPKEVFTKEFFQDTFEVETEIIYNEKTKRLNIIYI
ncbi:MAG: ABC transporter ATP-binding protein [Clostridium sp.]